MSEKVTKLVSEISEDSLPESLSADSLRVTRDANNRVHIHGWQNGHHKRFSQDDLIRSYGHDPAEWDKKFLSSKWNKKQKKYEKEGQPEWETWIQNHREDYLARRNLGETVSENEAPDLTLKNPENNLAIGDMIRVKTADGKIKGKYEVVSDVQEEDGKKYVMTWRRGHGVEKVYLPEDEDPALVPVKDSGWLSKIRRPRYSKSDQEVFVTKEKETRRSSKIPVLLGALALVGVGGLVLEELTEDENPNQNRTEQTIVENQETLINQNKTIIGQNETRNDLLETNNKKAAYENKLLEKGNILELQARNELRKIRILEEKEIKLQTELQLSEEGSEEANASASRNQDGAIDIFVDPGHGYTQEIKELFPGRSAETYYNAHLAAVDQFGPNYILNVPTYKTAAGEVRFSSTGRGLIPPRVHSFLMDYFKNHPS